MSKLSNDIDYDQIYEFVEPHTFGGTSFVRMTAAQAIAVAKKVAKSYNREITDKEALDDFIVTHWAYPYKEQNNG